MSHTTVIGLSCTMEDLTSNSVVQSILNDMGWKVATPDSVAGSSSQGRRGGIEQRVKKNRNGETTTEYVYKGYDGSEEKIENVLIIPEEHSGSYGVDLSPAKAKELGLKDDVNYKILGLKTNKEGGLGMIADDFQISAQTRIDGAVAAAKAMSNIEAGVSELPAECQAEARPVIVGFRQQIVKQATAARYAGISVESRVNLT